MVSKSEVMATALYHGGANFRQNDVHEEFNRLFKEGILVDGKNGLITTKRLAARFGRLIMLKLKASQSIAF